MGLADTIRAHAACERAPGILVPERKDLVVFLLDGFTERSKVEHIRCINATVSLLYPLRESEFLLHYWSVRTVIPNGDSASRITFSSPTAIMAVRWARKYLRPAAFTSAAVTAVTFWL